MFDLFTTFSVGLVYLMYRAFDELYVFKPVTSRPANSERYGNYIHCQYIVLIAFHSGQSQNCTDSSPVNQLKLEK